MPRLASTCIHNVDITDVDALKMEAIFNQYSFWYPPWLTTVKITGLQSQNDSPATVSNFLPQRVFSNVQFEYFRLCLSSLPRLRECVLWEFFVNTEHRLYVEWLSSWWALALSWDRKSPLYSLSLCVFRPWWTEASGWLVCACEKLFPYNST